jgi:hypothetical protein
MAFQTANSSFEAFGHDLTIIVLGLELATRAFFFADPNIAKNVLGRSGWLDRVRLGLIDYEGSFISRVMTKANSTGGT